MKRKQPALKLNTNNFESIYGTIIIAVTILLFIFPAITGVYYDEEFMPMHIISGLCIIGLLFAYRGKVELFSKEVDYLMLVLVFSYGLSIIWSVQTQWALEEFLKYINYFLVFWYLSKLTSEKDIEGIIKIFVVIGIILSFLSILAFLGIINTDRFVSNGRIIATIKYTNSFAAYISAMIVLGIYLLSREDKYKWIYQLGCYIMLVAFIGTFSRAMWLLFIPVLFIYLIAYPRKNRRNVATASVIIVLISLISASIVFGDFIFMQKLLTLGVGCCAVVYSTFAADTLNNVKINRVLLAAVVSLVGLAGVVAAVKYNMNNPIIKRITEINWAEASVQVRLTYYGDVIKIIKDYNPIMGTGGGGWRALYPVTKTFLYYSKEAHSYLMQVGLEAGLFGILSYVGIILYTAINTIRARDSRKWAIGFALGIIFLHSTVDFDLSLGFVALLTWAMLGCFARLTSGFKFKEVVIPKVYLIIITLLFVIICTPIAISTNYSQLGDQEAYTRATYKLNKAIAFYPLNSKNYATLALVHSKAYEQTKDKKFLKEALVEIEKAIMYDPTNYNWHTSKATYQLMNGEPDAAIRTLQDGRKYIFKFDNRIFTKTADLLRQIALQYEGNRNIDGMRIAEREILSLWSKAENDVSSVPPNLIQFWQQEELLTEYDPFLLEVINAFDFLGEKDKAKKLVNRLSEETIQKNEWLKKI